MALSTPGQAQQSTQNPNAAPPQTLPRPKLVVGILVDQMRWDYLYRYYDRYQPHGFKRMLNEGFSAENASIDYIPTVTAIGHATAYTGTVPSIHGIAGNHFKDQAGKTIYCADDATVQTVGSASTAGQMSPRNLLTTTITDELKLATNFRSKVIGIAMKDRGSIFPAGHTADAAYWFDDATGNWITSTWYMKELPAWVQKFNEQKLVEKYLNQGWNTLYPIESYIQSTPDQTDYERKLKGAETVTFPIDTAKLYQAAGAEIMHVTPYGNTFTLDMAKAAIENEALGRRDVTDFLAVSLSSTDYIGHYFGPNAIETEDTYLRLDQDLGAFLSYLDAQVGQGQYTVFLSADHGGTHNLAFLKDNKIPAGAWDGGAVRNALDTHLQTLFGTENLVQGVLNYQIYLNGAAVREKGLDFDRVKKEAVRFLGEQEGIAYAVDMENAQNASVPAAIRTRIINGYHRGRSGDVQIILKPGWYSSGSERPTGATHSAWNPYDAHIPLIFMGWGVNQGQTARAVNMTDITPTLASLLRIQEPNGSIGAPIVEVLSSEKINPR